MISSLKSLAIVILLAVVGFQYVSSWDAKGVSRFLSAYNGFLSEAALLNCLRADQVQALAEQRGWELVQPDPQQTIPAQPSLRLFVSPPLPFSKEPGIGMRFDDQGCWTKASPASD